MSEKENYCERHDVNIEQLPDDYTFCPYCREEERIEAERMEKMTRDPRVEPY